MYACQHVSTYDSVPEQRAVLYTEAPRGATLSPARVTNVLYVSAFVGISQLRPTPHQGDHLRPIFSSKILILNHRPDLTATTTCHLFSDNNDSHHKIIVSNGYIGVWSILYRPATAPTINACVPIIAIEAHRR